MENVKDYNELVLWKVEVSQEKLNKSLTKIEIEKLGGREMELLISLGEGYVFLDETINIIIQITDKCQECIKIQPRQNDGCGGTLLTYDRMTGYSIEGISLTNSDISNRPEIIPSLIKDLMQKMFILIRSPPYSGKTSLAQILENCLVQSQHFSEYRVIRISILWASAVKMKCNWETFGTVWKKIIGKLQWNFWNTIKANLQGSSNVYIIMFGAYGYGANSAGLSTPVTISEENSKSLFDIKFTDYELEDYVKIFCDRYFLLLDNNILNDIISKFSKYIQKATAGHAGLFRHRLHNIKMQWSENVLIWKDIFANVMEVTIIPKLPPSLLYNFIEKTFTAICHGQNGKILKTLRFGTDGSLLEQTWQKDGRDMGRDLYKIYKVTIETEHDLSFSTRDFVVEGIELDGYGERTEFWETEIDKWNDMSIFNRFQANDTPYVEYKDEEDPEEGASDNFILRPTTTSIPSSSRNKSPKVSSFQPFTANRQQQRYQQVYSYYIGKGIYCILLKRFLNVLTLGFVMGFSTFLLGCVDYSLVRHSHSLTEVIIPKCLSHIFWMFQIIRFLLDIPRLIDMYNFYTYLLKIEDADMQTVSWQHVVNKIIQIKDNNPTTSRGSNINIPQQRLDAINITNRIMRQENYLVALFNKELLNLTIPIPIPFFQKRNILTKTLEWNLNWCILNYIFNDKGQVRKRFITKNSERDKLVKELEFRSNPGSFFSRKWSRYARWKFREFNELPHLFNQRISKILVLASYIDPELLIFEISNGRSVLFYTGIFIPILVVTRSTIPDEHIIFDPEERLKKVVEHTHYAPNGWTDRMHTDGVRKEFSELFVGKVMLDVQEILSVIFTPFILWLSLPDCKFTVHIDGLEYVCSFAVFDFKRHGNLKYGAPVEVNNEYYLSKDGKMEKSFLNFKANHPDWEPADPTGSLYLNNLSRLTEVNNHVRPQHRSNYSGRIPALDSIIKPNNNNNRRSGNIHFQNGQEFYAASDMSDSYSGADIPLTESIDQDRPRNDGVIGLLNQFYKEINHSSM
ncbi:1564_t:CDS:10 [Diversispora eburnea]|uniref:Autophagy-related protein 9 n=1 Tax=Diversispora eburnea TaxID=1213867 RepID=A0A9N8UVM3_9GLOM|nr:1564_t:CDS:10 [Diversispora eburnea]